MFLQGAECHHAWVLIVFPPRVTYVEFLHFLIFLQVYIGLEIQDY